MEFQRIFAKYRQVAPPIAFYEDPSHKYTERVLVQEWTSLGNADVVLIYDLPSKAAPVVTRLPLNIFHVSEVVDIDAYPFQARSCVTTLEELNESMQASYEMKQLPTIASTDILVRMNGYAVGSLIAFERYDGSMYYRVVRAQ